MSSIQAVGTLEQARASQAATLTRLDAAAIAGVDPRTITAGIRDGVIPAIKIGRRVLIPREKFLKLFDGGD
ncbi:helix-turn-helix domain-containing protein [Leucobacter japonicus]|uniref:helix-turn-helix domain-containing protein n=1 Tax=Leucobacter japonicus TaxID=1461259 RepID=UPI0006A78174|nr:helix-turn-helix domain-containing protein [Leucobacter japonicus]